MNSQNGGNNYVGQKNSKTESGSNRLGQDLGRNGRSNDQGLQRDKYQEKRNRRASDGGGTLQTETGDNGQVSIEDDTSENDVPFSLKDESVSDYGENSKHEDFADACGNYFANPDSFEKKYPNRTFLLKGIYQ